MKYTRTRCIECGGNDSKWLSPPPRHHGERFFPTRAMWPLVFFFFFFSARKPIPGPIQLSYIFLLVKFVLSYTEYIADDQLNGQRSRTGKERHRFRDGSKVSEKFYTFFYSVDLIISFGVAVADCYQSQWPYRLYVKRLVTRANCVVIEGLEVAQGAKTIMRWPHCRSIDPDYPWILSPFSLYVYTQ